MKFNFNLEKRNLYTYEEYRLLMSQLLSAGKTTGMNQSESMITYTELNEVRMNRWDKTFKVDEQLIIAMNAIGNMSWLVITEAWCGDAAQNLPMIAKIADQLPTVDLKIILRDENLDIMDEFLTNNSRSIPKLIAFATDGSILFEWGPRPTELQEQFIEMKNMQVPSAESKLFMHKWYAKNKGQEIQKDILQAIQALEYA